MADIPNTIVLKRDRDLARARLGDLATPGPVFALLPVVVIPALVNLFGQRPSSSAASSAAAALKLYAPSRVRGELLFEVRFRISARQDLKKAIPGS